MVLALELAFIRLVPAEVRAISYFTNLLLMSAFFGFGLGCLLEKRRDFDLLLPVGLLATWGFVLYARGLVIHAEAGGVHYWLQYDQPAEQARSLPLSAAAMLAFVAAAGPFVALGQGLARRMAEHPRLIAYGWDIFGSLAGIVAFTITSYLALPPWVWPPLVGIAWSIQFARTRGLRVMASLAGLLFLWFAQTPFAAQWSPYYFVQSSRESLGLRVWVNSSFHQFAIDFRSEDPGLAAEREFIFRKFSAPYDAYRKWHGGRSPERVLILGAGTGNDVWVARQNGAQRIVAVEIDPVILDLGHRENPTQPYADPRVTTVVTDARHYVKTAGEKFDLVLLATLDSQTLLSGHANLRLENYVYTVEAFRDMRALLSEQGMLGAYYSLFRPWLYSRIYATVAAAFDGRVVLHQFENRFLFNTLLLAAPGIEEFQADPGQVALFRDAIPATDDWPFLYLEAPTIAPLYRQVGLFILALVGAAALLARRLYPARALYLEYFGLGLGFTLCESAAIVRMALLFGSTWVVNSLVFGSFLLMVFLANHGVIRGWAPSLPRAWAGVIGGLLLNWWLPLDLLLILPPVTQSVAAALLIGAPVFCASVCFSRLFERSQDLGGAFGMNLIDAMTGGLVEYVSMLIGMRAVWLLATGVYLAAWLAARARRP